jgi:hypothetical protein
LRTAAEAPKICLKKKPPPGFSGRSENRRQSEKRLPGLKNRPENRLARRALKPDLSLPAR